MTGNAKFFTWPTIVAASIVLICVALFAYRPKQERNVAQEQETAALLELQSKLFSGISRYNRQAALDGVDELGSLVANRASARAYAALLVYLDAEGNRNLALKTLDQFAGDSELDTAVRQAVEDPEKLTPVQTALIHNELGWSGCLLLSQIDQLYRDKAETTGLKLLLVFGIFTAIAGLAFFLGMILFIIAIFEFRSGKRQLRFKPESPYAPRYLESFAVYLLGMIGLSLLVSLIPTGSATGWVIFTIFGSLALSLGWLRLRGIPWNAIRRDLGIHRGTGIVSEMCAGVTGYLTLLPVLAMGVIITIVFQKILTSPDTTAAPVTHPVFAMAQNASVGTMLLILGMASIAAPIAEEIMFRGALLRALHSRFAMGLALFGMAFIFAAVHPQGVIAIPGLMAMAISLGLMREWRDSLIASATAHGLHNGVIMVLLWVALG